MQQCVAGSFLARVFRSHVPFHAALVYGILKTPALAEVYKIHVS